MFSGLRGATSTTRSDSRRHDMESGRSQIDDSTASWFSRACMPTVRYWMEVEVHVYAFSIAANVLLSFYPFLIVIVSICRYVLKWPGAEQAILLAVNDFLPGAVGEFVEYNVKVTVSQRGPLQIGSILLLFFTANGIFEPLEVALNRAWGITKNRSFFKNQLISLGLIFIVGALALLSAILTGANRDLALRMAGGNAQAAEFISLVVFKSLALPISILILFLVYWLLPNKRLRAADVLPVAVLVGIGLEVLKYLNLIALPWLTYKLQREYGPFQRSAAIVLWSFFAAMIVLAGAEWSARRGLGPRPLNSRMLDI
jgi:YihY family inner membrane protein